MHTGGIPPPQPATDPSILQLWAAGGFWTAGTPSSQDSLHWSPPVAPWQALSQCHQQASYSRTASDTGIRPVLGEPATHFLLTLGLSLPICNISYVNKDTAQNNTRAQAWVPETGGMGVSRRRQENHSNHKGRCPGWWEMIPGRRNAWSRGPQAGPKQCRVLGKQHEAGWARGTGRWERMRTEGSGGPVRSWDFILRPGGASQGG